MKKKYLIAVTSVIVVAIGLLIGVAIKNSQSTPIWETNAIQLNNSLLKIDTASINSLIDYTTFEWDTLYSFSPYTPEEEIYKVVGYQWDKINSTVSEGLNQIVFVHKGQVICYIAGQPNKHNVFFDFGQYEGSHFKLTSSDRLAFSTVITDKGIRRFEYIK